MSNTIDIQIGGNNTMETLTYYWVAKFTDGTLWQFKDGKEHKFQEVLDRSDKLLAFYLVDKTGVAKFTVDLIDGYVSCGNSPVTVATSCAVRLIYFRRNRVELGEDLIEKSRNIIYCLGYQYNDNSGANHKVILYIDSNGNWVVKGE